jgi:hypothetical protein
VSTLTPSQPSVSPQTASAGAEFLRVFSIVLAIKYSALSIEILVYFIRNVSNIGITDAVALLTRRAWIAGIAAFPAACALVLWVRRGRASGGTIAMAAIFVHAVATMIARGQEFANHHVLQAIVGVIGVLAVARQRAGDTARRAWAPMAWLGVAVWGLAGAKKLLSGSYLNGEFLASLANSSRRTLFTVASDTLVGGGRGVPDECCFTGHITVSRTAAYLLVAAGIGMALAEISPVVAARIAPARLVGWLMFGLAIVATSIANEMDFGLVLIALAGLWGQGRVFERVCVLTAMGMAWGFLWTVLR